ncbi:Secreted protein acidic and rich in cysteine Ca binding region [Mactra antiquata]
MKTLLAVAIILASVLVFCESRKKFDDEYFSKHHHKKSRLRGSHLRLREGGVRSLHDGWLKQPKETECVKTKCRHEQICIANPKTGDEKCVDKGKLREGKRLFHTFHKEEKAHSTMKDVNPDLLKHELDTAEHMKDVYDLIKDYNKDLKSSEKKIDLKKDFGNKKSTSFASSTNDCQAKQMYDLKRRLVGWSVLQHTESRMRHHRMKHHKKFDYLKKSGSRKFKKVPSKYGILKKDNTKHDIVKRSTHVDTVQTESHHKCKCSKSVMWEFRKQDQNRDGELNHDELSVLETNRMEPCLHPLFKSCDKNSDGILTHGEWCCCMADTIPPCFDKKRSADRKFYIPNCDREGYYRREQCLKDKSWCWCVDINGNEIIDTKRAGRAECGKYDPNGRLIKE